MSTYASNDGYESLGQIASPQVDGLLHTLPFRLPGSLVGPLRTIRVAHMRYHGVVGI